MQHTEHHITNSQTIGDIVIGMADGLTVPFALAAGLSGAISSTSIITTAGLAEIVAGCIAMGLGGYLAGKTEEDYYSSELSREYQEVEDVPEKEKEETRLIFSEIGISKEVQNLIVEELSRDKKKWVDFMMKFELGLEKPHPNRAAKSAFTIGLSYAVGGIIPLMPYFFVTSAHQGLLFSSAITVVCLFVFGYFKSSITGQNPIWGACKVTFIGVLAAATAYTLTRLIS